MTTIIEVEFEQATRVAPTIGGRQRVDCVSPIEDNVICISSQGMP